MKGPFSVYAHRSPLFRRTIVEADPSRPPHTKCHRAGEGFSGEVWTRFCRRLSSMLPQLCCAESCGCLSRTASGVAAWRSVFDGADFFAAHRIADSCTLKDRVKRARIPLRSTTRDSLLCQNFAHTRRMGSSASYSSRMRAMPRCSSGSSTRTRRPWESVSFVYRHP